MKEQTALIKSLLSICYFTEEQLNQFNNKLTYKTLQKKELYLKPNETAKDIAFILKGSLRLYTETTESELTIKFFTENQWVSDLESLLTQQATKNYIQACENTSLACISLKSIHQLIDADPGFSMLNALIASSAITSAHIATINTKSPDERYKELLLEHPDWIKRFPQIQIASLLGMTPETLSRVKARLD